MNHATPKMRYLADRLMAHAAQGNRSKITEFPTALPVVSKLRPHLATLMGASGFDSLLARALALGGTEIPWLLEVGVKTDGSLEGFDELAGRVDPGEITRGSVVLIATLLGLLVAFIGEILTLRLLREIWPKFPNGEYFTLGDKNEKTN